jgi:FAD-linked sulfhydryl oxidase
MATSGPASGPSIPGTSGTLPKRTTKETHPNLPPGLILDADGKVCKVCNSWQDWARVKLVKKADGEDGSGAGGAGTGTGAGKGKGRAMGGMGGFAAMMGGSASGVASSSNAASSSSSSSVAAGATPSLTPTPGRTDRTDRTDCPPDTAALGRSTWTFLHTTAAYYPLSASHAQQTHMRNLLSSIATLYPCSWCATDFAEDIARNPPDRPERARAQAVAGADAATGTGADRSGSAMSALSGREALSRWLCERHNEVNRKLGKSEFVCTWERLGERWKDGPADGRCD